MSRTAEMHRVTTETDVRLRLDLDGGTSRIDAEHGFLAHLLEQVARHGRLGIDLDATGDVHATDPHHLAEDVGIVLGQALREALGDSAGIERYGAAWVPMDETLAHVVLDLSGRPYLAFAPEGYEGDAHGFRAHHLREFLRGFANHAQATLHVRILAMGEAHHVCEAAIKALARALHRATRTTHDTLPSTKGTL